MPFSTRIRSLAAAAACAAATVPLAAASGAFTLSVDSIMRGPKLVGYPQTGLRWSGDSARLYFEWRRPGDDEALVHARLRERGNAVS